LVAEPDPVTESSSSLAWGSIVVALLGQRKDEWGKEATRR
jgi:hypothetical protein